MTKVYIMRKDENYIERALERHFQKNENVTVCKNTDGKPYLCGVDGMFISVSHSDAYAAVIISDKNVGIDIERYEVRDYLSLSSRYFSTGERALNERTFYEFWTKKEAYSKFLGKPLSLGLLSTDMKEVEESGIPFFFKEMLLFNEMYYLTVCGELSMEFVHLI